MSPAKQAHRRLAGFIGIFLAVHFATHFGALAGFETQDAIMRLGREVYRIPPVELLLVAALLAQVVLGVRLLGTIRRRKRKDAWHWAQFLSGAYLAYFIVAHTAAALGTRLLAELDTDFHWPAATLLLDPLRWVFAPYYVLAVSALVAHLFAALHFRKPAKWHTPALAIGPLSGIAIVLAYGGWLYRVTLPSEYLDFFRLYGAWVP